MLIALEVSVVFCFVAAGVLALCAAAKYMEEARGVDLENEIRAGDRPRV